MMDTLKLTVENLARIRRAEVEIKPLTIFFGKNNTNKSYMAHVVYGLYKYLPEVVVSKIERLVVDLLNTERSLGAVIEKLKNPSDDLVEEILKDLQERIIQSFRGRGFNQLKLHRTGLAEYVTDFLRRVAQLSPHFTLFYKKIYEVDVIYFPASRTGFVLAFDALITGILKERYALKRPHEKLTEPVVDFLVTFNNIRSFSESLEGKSKESELLKKLSEMIGGEIWIDEDTKQLYYHPRGARGRKKIEMHLVSSSVTELAPIYIFLANSEILERKFFVIEEPEAHLHPENQIKMAELIIQMVKKGAKVLITTHSDYILNALNICIQRFWAGVKDKVSLDPRMVSAYIFREAGGNIEVSPLPVEEEEGISFENFYSAAEFLIEEEEEVRHILKRRKREGVQSS